MSTGLRAGTNNDGYLQVSGTDVLTALSSGNVGIGTSTPNTYNNYNALTINGTNGGEVDFEINGTLSADIFANSTGLRLQTRTELPIVLSTYNGANVIERLTLTTDGNVRVPDNGNFTAGAGDDLKLYHNATNSYIENTTGDLYLQCTGSGDDILIQSMDDIFLNPQGGNNGVNILGGGRVELYYNNSEKFRTQNTGAKVTGALEVTQEYPTIRPVLDLNFAATKTLDRRITFKRNSIGTYIGEDGLVKYASNNVPRFDHDFDTRESLGLLIEESRTNKFTYSTTIGGTGWNQQGTAADYTTNTTEVAAPDGTFTALKWNPSVIPQYLYQNLSNIGTTQSTMSVWVRCPAGQSRTFFMNLYSPTQGGAAGQFTATDQWQRFTWTFTPQSQANVYPIVPDSTGIYYIWAPQLEEGAFPTSYIPTSGSTVTRAQDTPLITGTNFTDFYNQSEGTLVLSADIAYLATSNQAAVVFEDTSSQSTDLIALGYRVGGGSSGNLGSWYQGNSTAVAYLDHNAGITANTEFRQTFAYKKDDLASVVNGTTPLTDNSGTLSTSIDRVRFGEYYADGITSGHIRQFKYYNKRLSNAQLQGLTQQ